jgi:hypothetical protein
MMELKVGYSVTLSTWPSSESMHTGWKNIVIAVHILLLLHLVVLFINM